MNTFLAEIIEYKKKELALQKEHLSLNELMDKARAIERQPSFNEAIKKSEFIHFIAEIKKASPSAGLLRENFNPLEIAKIYSESRVSAISVITDEKYFQGSLLYLKSVSKETPLPLLRKDFIIDQYQIYESKIFGASAVLLIVAVLSNKQLLEYIHLAEKLSLDTLVEIHNEDELDRALSAGARTIGINNRDLKSFKVDIGIAQKIIPRIPKTKTIVVESGIQSRREVELFQEMNVDALLIGETFMKALNIKDKISELRGQAL